MLTTMISKMDRAILEIALINAFSDMCFYEGEEFMADLESYVNDVENKTNTEEQDNLFFELSLPYIEKTIMAYYEGAPKPIHVGADETSAKLDKSGGTGSDVNRQTSESGKQKFKSIIKDSEEIDTAAWDTLIEAIFPAVKEGIEKAKKKMSEVGGRLSLAAKASIAAAQKKLQAHLSGFKIGGQSATASPAKK